MKIYTNRLIVRFKTFDDLRTFKRESRPLSTTQLYCFGRYVREGNLSQTAQKLFNTAYVSHKSPKVSMAPLYQELKKDSRVAYVQYDQEYMLSTGTDPAQTTTGWWFNAINSLQSLQPYASIYPIKVAVIDTGIDHKHHDINQTTFIPENRRDFKKLKWVNDVLQNPNGDTINWNTNGDNDLHGTHVAGIIGALLNSTHTVGLANLATLMNLRAYPNATEISLSTAMAYAIRKNAKVINASWGTRVTSQNPNVGSSLQDLIDHANSKGLVVVVAAGNDGEDVAGHVPARFENVITVGSINASPANEYIRADSSNYGDKVIGAPGVNISSLMANDNSQMLNLSGSSMSAGFVSGLVARMLQKKPTIIPKDLTGINTATTVLSYIKRLPIQQDANIIGQEMIDVDSTLNNL